MTAVVKNQEYFNQRGWTIYRSNNWIARHTTGKKITAGTILTLLSLLDYEEWQSPLIAGINN